MRESRLYGSVRGVAGDRYPYRDSGYQPRSWKARACSGVASVSCWKVVPLGSDGIRQVLRQRVASSRNSVSKL